MMGQRAERRRTGPWPWLWLWPERMRKSPDRLLRAATAALLGLAVSGCAHVQPWERERLAAPEMAPEGPALIADYRRHIAQSKEAARIAGGSSGSGCGCN